MSRSRLLWVGSGALVLAAVVAACGGDSGRRDAGNADAGAKADGGAGGVTQGKLMFTACPLITDHLGPPPSGPLEVGDFDGVPSPRSETLAQTDSLADLESATAECATVKLPAVWSDPQGDQIDVFVKRYPARVQPAIGQLWMLAGGPGLPGSLYERLAFLIARTIPTLDIYLPDHRGTGGSTQARCDSFAAISSCAADTAHLDGLTVTGAARDLGWLIDASHRDSQRVFIYAASYGTYWAQRYLQIRPKQPNAVVLDSTVPVGADTSTSDKNCDDAAHAVLELCRADTTCAAKLDGDPIAKAHEAIAAVKAGTCKLPRGMPALLSRYFGSLVSLPSFELPLLPASIYRVLRCNNDDLAWFGKVQRYLQWPGLPSGNSDVAWVHIVLSEFWQTDASYAQLLADEEPMLAMTNSAWFASLKSSWPTYPRDECGPLGEPVSLVVASSRRSKVLHVAGTRRVLVEGHSAGEQHLSELSREFITHNDRTCDTAQVGTLCGARGGVYEASPCHNPKPCGGPAASCGSRCS